MCVLRYFVSLAWAIGPLLTSKLWPIVPDSLYFDTVMSIMDLSLVRVIYIIKFNEKLLKIKQYFTVQNVNSP